MKDFAKAEELAKVMVQIGQDAGVKISALLTDMSTPLGRKIGNALEVEESVEVLAGGGPKDVVDLTVLLAEEMLKLAGKPDVDVRAALNDGRAMDRWNAMISAQGGDPKAALPKAKFEHVVTATETGVLSKLDALSVGIASWRLGAGRARKEDPVQFGAGIVLSKVQGESVTKGEPLLTLYTDDEARFDRAMESLEGGIEIGATATERKLLLGHIQG
jgi:thymidine phosphorylase